VEQLTGTHSNRRFSVVPIQTGGDIFSVKPLMEMGRGVFVKEIENALLDGRIDIAVHSLKDLPTIMPDGLVIGAVCQRIDHSDVLVNCWACSMGDLPKGARIGTSSPRRVAQLKEARPDVVVIPIRGNVETRLSKADGGDYDGVIIAAAGLIRLNLQNNVAQKLSVDQFVPAPGQGAVAIQARADDVETLELVSDLEDNPTRGAVTAERYFLEALGGGCETPVGAYGYVEGDLLTLTVYLASANGGMALRAKVEGKASNPYRVGMDAYWQLMGQGAKALIGSE
jgi:hydroxymethylbilane synthase